MKRTLTQHELLRLIMSALEGETAGIARVDLEGEPGYVRFTWWRTRFRVSARSLHVDVVDGDVLRHNETATLLERLLRATCERLAAIETELAAGGVG